MKRPQLVSPLARFLLFLAGLMLTSVLIFSWEAMRTAGALELNDECLAPAVVGAIPEGCEPTVITTPTAPVTVPPTTAPLPEPEVSSTSIVRSDWDEGSWRVEDGELPATGFTWMRALLGAGVIAVGGLLMLPVLLDREESD